MNAFSRISLGGALASVIVFAGCGEATIGAFAPDGGSSKGDGGNAVINKAPTQTSANTSAFDGTWDIISVGDQELDASEMTIAAGKITGTVVFPDEGEDIGGCVRTKHRTQFSVQIQDGKVSGAIHRLSEGCYGDESRSRLLNGTRAESGGGDLGGEWNVQYDGHEAIAVLIDGLAAQAWSLSDRVQDKEPSVNVVVAGDLVTVTSKRSDYRFSARKR